MAETFKGPENPPPIFNTEGALHPNRIGTWGLGTQVAGFAVESIVGTNNLVALSGMAVGGLADVADGKVAKKWPTQLKTVEGAKLDPLLDKIKTYITASYILAHNTNPQVALCYLVNFGIDYLSTAQRGPITEQFREAIRAVINPSSCSIDTKKESGTRANRAGKGKTLLQNGTGFALVGENLIRENALPYLGLELESAVYQQANAAGLAVAAVLGGVGVYQKAKVKNKV